jgi:hypothetical protein
MASGRAVKLGNTGVNRGSGAGDREGVFKADQADMDGNGVIRCLVLKLVKCAKPWDCAAAAVLGRVDGRVWQVDAASWAFCFAICWARQCESIWIIMSQRP